MSDAEKKPRFPERTGYTYTDILTWDERYELLDGEARMMAPPNRAHQELLGELFAQLHGFLRGKPGKVYPAPFGVRLFPRKDNQDDTFLEPDITVVCDLSKLDDQGCKGAPDLVVEILSPSTAKHDLLYKLNKYLQAGVREYWIADPDEKILHVYTLVEGSYRLSKYDAGDKVTVTVLPGCLIDLRAVFTG
ncbi:MAG: Uma2 family endonuclease [Spirochaetaceae bacterium]|jgi:Uma2 family endonuclease|nr:Uma2 family endonuclease [Spirochaetaceae bacterium]